MRKIITTTLIVIFTIILTILMLGVYKFNFTDNDIYFTCTEEAMICSDGSTVVRTGKNCEFELCPKINSILSESEARLIAEKSCIKGGESLSSGIYNSNTKTWWYDANLNATREGCNPACVVNEETKIAELNWRCTGLINIPNDINNYSGNKLLKEGEKCGESIGSCGSGLKCAYPCGILGCQNICMSENELPKP